MKKYYHHIYNAFYFPLRAINLRLKLLPIDHKSPFLGKLSKSGIFGSTLSDKAIEHLQTVYREFNDGEKIDLKAQDAEVLKEVFDIVAPIVKEYLGKNSYIDGINWMVKRPGETSISGSWHTDNVGNRIKCFICIEGDGSQPTLVVPSENRIPNYSIWLKHTLIEIFRWFGLQNYYKFGHVHSCNHETGTIFLFDTQLLHRGGYESSKGQRVIFHMEFSVPLKHELANGPIGTSEINSFSFDEKLLDIESFSCLIDPSRVNENCTNRIYE